MSEPLCEVGKLRICPEAHAVLHAEATLRGEDCNAIALAREIVEAWALGRSHGLTLLRRRMERAGIGGSAGERAR
jgi:hypothetical protein